MKLFKKSAVMAILLVACWGMSVSGQSVEKADSSFFRSKTVIVKLKPENPVLKTQPSIDHKDFRMVLTSIEAETIEPLFKEFTVASLRKKGLPEHSLSRVYLVRYSSDESVIDACKRFSKSEIVEYAEPYYYFSVSYVPNDPFIGKGLAIDTLQYYLDRVKAFDAWDITKGDPDIVIGIVDDGNQLHEDLTGNLKYNDKDPIDGIDNDNDGYIDNYNGWDVADKDADPFGNSHGVAVTGTCCSKPDNTKGIAGTGFNTSYLPIKAAADMINGMPNYSNLITNGYEGLLYAAEHGCQVINLSWGSTGRSQLLEELVNYVVLVKDVVVVAAAGNEGNEESFYPAAYENVLAVAACSTFFSTEYNDWVETRAGFSSYGSFVDICAPGWLICTTGGQSNYYYTNGTSFSSPIVAGAAALVRAKFPELSALQVMERLRVTADVIDTFSFNKQYQGKLGRGRLNMYKALLNAALPSVRLKNEVVQPIGERDFSSGGKGAVRGDLVNYLDNTQNLYVKLSTDFDGLVIDNPVYYA
ncbi:MAG TPA: S8 family serine peptidase, partial [Cytophagaceae bacterium]